MIDEKKLIERLEEVKEKHQPTINGKTTMRDLEVYKMTIGYAKEIVNQLAEEQEHCIKSSCSNCETYDKEKHYCPKFCKVITEAVAEIEENHKDDFCEWESDFNYISGQYKRNTKCGYTFYDLHHAIPFKYCPYCSKKVVPYQPKGQ